MADLNGAIGAAVDAHGGVLPAKQRLQLHATQAASASRQIALLRAFGAVGVPVERLPARVSEAQLAAGSRPSVATPPRGRPVRRAADRPGALAAADDGDVLRLQLIVVEGRRRRPRRRRPPRAPPPPGVSNLASLMMDGPWDRASGRKGVRHVTAPATLPAAVRYRFCAAPVHVLRTSRPIGHAFRKKPAMMLRRRAVNGYNGLGTHNRAPNVHTRSARTHRGSRAQFSPASSHHPASLQVHALATDGCSSPPPPSASSTTLRLARSTTTKATTMM